MRRGIWKKGLLGVACGFAADHPARELVDDNIFVTCIVQIIIAFMLLALAKSMAKLLEVDLDE